MTATGTTPESATREEQPKVDLTARPGRLPAGREFYDARVGGAMPSFDNGFTSIRQNAERVDWVRSPATET